MVGKDSEALTVGFLLYIYSIVGCGGGTGIRGMAGEHLWGLSSSY
jgi:hypothetical protein